MQEITNALSHAIAVVIALWLPVLAGIGILWLVIRVSHGHVGKLLGHISQEISAFTRRKTNSLSINLVGGLVISALIIFYVIESSAVHMVEIFKDPSQKSEGASILTYVFLLMLFFIGCPVACKYFDPDA